MVDMIPDDEVGVVLQLKTQKEAESLLGECHFFSEVDPFNLSNKVEGWVGTKPDHRYGALFITSINGIPTHQFILATPKLHYPFDRAGRYNFPSAQRIEVYTKLDGTNCFQFRYIRPDGQRFISYKTRLRPFLQDGGRWGNFLSWWKELLGTYPNIPKLWNYNPNVTGFSYEIFGAINKHLIEYPFPLKAALLFGVGKDGNIVPPSEIDAGDVPTTRLESVITRDYVASYEQAQLDMDGKLKASVMGGYTGDEGQVWYLKDKTDQWIMLKCKPPTIEQIHWSSGGIGKETLRATAYNVFENEVDVSVDGVIQLLKEEFTDEQIAKAGIAIEKVVADIQVELAFRSTVESILDTILMLPLEAATCPMLPQLMRQLSPNFHNSQMSRVYGHTRILLERKMGRDAFEVYLTRTTK